MKKFIKKPIVIIIVFIVIVGVVIGYNYFGRSKKLDYSFIIAEKGDVIQEVSVIGKVKPSESVDLAFEKSGRVVWINTKIGNKVYSNQSLIQLYNADLIAQLANARADVKAQQAKLAELKRGTRPEEIKIQEVKVENAKISLEETKKNLVNKLQDAYTKSDDAIRNRIDQFFSNPRSFDPKINFTITDSQLKTDIEQKRFLIENILVLWKLSLDNLTTSSDLNFYINEEKQNLNGIRSLLDKTALAVNALKPSSSISQTTINNYKSDVSTGRTNVNTAITNLSTAEEKLKTAESGLLVKENELILLITGTAVEQITAQEALVEKAEASIQNIKAQITKTIIISPITGIVTKQEAKVGEIVAANETIITVISGGDFSAQGGPASGWEIESDVPEADIAKIKIGDNARLTLDAYGDDIEFTASVVSIDPAETVIEGVSNYKVTLHFDEKDERIRSGMTANLDILTAEHENVIAIPQPAVISKDGQKFVRVLEGEEIKEREVKTGLRGSFGNIEIIEGLTEGDKVITFIKK